MDYLSLCLITRDENSYLPEWLDYHIVLGVERFYIYDNQSKVSLHQSLGDYISKGWVVVNEITGQEVQLAAYDHCLRSYGNQSRWIGFIDTDEFIVPKTTSDLRLFMEAYEEFGGLAISTLVFGSAAHVQKPDGLQISNFRWRTPTTYSDNLFVKSIVQPEKVLFPLSPHSFTYKDKAFCVNEYFLRVDRQNFPNHTERIQLNHYFCRSRDEFQSKLQRGRGDGGISYQWGKFDQINRLATVYDESGMNVLREIIPADTPPSEANSVPLPGLEIHLRTAANRLTTVKHAPPLILKDFSPSPALQAYLKHYNKSKTAFERGEWTAAIAELETLLEQHPQVITFHIALIRTCMAMKDYPAAWQALQNALDVAPSSYDILSYLRTYHLYTKDYPKAELVCRQLLEQGPDEVAVLLDLAGCLASQRKFEEAADILERAASVGADSSNFSQTTGLMKQMATHFFNTGNNTQAARFLEWVLKQEPQDTATIIKLAWIDFNLKNYPQARALFERVQQLDPDNKVARKGLELIEQAINKPQDA